MLHKPKISTLKHLHSIPRYFMHSIPIGSLVALLTLNLILINPVIQSQTYALEEDVGRNTESSTLTTEKENNSNNITNNTNNNSSTSSSVRDTATNDNEDINNTDNNDLATVEREDSPAAKANADVDSNSDISLQAASTSTASLTIAGAGLDDIVPATAGEVAYRKHTITVDAPNSEEYYLIINGPTSLSGSTTISGADNKTPSEMLNNSWGYAYSDTSTEDTLNYQSFTGTAETIDSGSGPTNFTKNLIFAAKFGSDAVSGHYTGQVTLSLASTPTTVVSPTDPVNNWAQIEYLQQMGDGNNPSEVCKNAPDKTPKELIDVRDNSKYNVSKLGDGKCWIITNLRIRRESVEAKDPTNTTGKLTSIDSNVGASGYELPTLSDNPWSDTHYNTNKIYYTNNTSYGAYYSWCAATAGSCDKTTSDGAIASSSICPKGWRLPTKAEYDAIISKQEGYDTAGGGYIFAGALFPAAGYVYRGSYQTGGSEARYWTSTAYSNIDAYFLAYGMGLTTRSSDRYTGCSIRCIAI